MNALPFHADPCVSMAREFFELETWGCTHSLTDDEVRALSDRCNVFVEQMKITPATSFAGIAAKLRMAVFGGWLQDGKIADYPGEDELLSCDDELLISALRDADALSFKEGRPTFLPSMLRDA